MSNAVLGRLAATLISAILLCLAGYQYGAARVQARWDAERQRTTLAVATTQTAQAQATTRVVTQYVDRIQTVRERGKTIVKEVPIYVPSTVSPVPSVTSGPHAGCDCSLPGGFRVLHDAAAIGTLPQPTAIADAPSVSAQDVAATVADNYLTCHVNAEQLSALQQWATQQQAVSAAQPETE